MPTPNTQVITLRAETASELVDALPLSGLYDLYDCTLELFCYADASVEDVDFIRRSIEAAINVADVVITSTPDTYGYKAVISEISLARAEGRSKK